MNIVWHDVRYVWPTKAETRGHNRQTWEVFSGGEGGGRSLEYCRELLYRICIYGQLLSYYPLVTRHHEFHVNTAKYHTSKKYLAIVNLRRLYEKGWLYIS